MECLNCGARLLGPHCSLCGQRHEPHPPTVGHLLGEAFETLTHADSRLWRTLRTLLTQPGTLTAEWFAGHRTRYLPPIRLYIVLSLGFFLLLALDLRVASGADATSRIDADCTELRYRGPLAEVAQPKLREACQRLKRDGGSSFESAFLRNMPKAMFVLLPLVAAFMLLLYWRPRRLYAEHLLHLVHNQSAIYAAFTVEFLLDILLPDRITGFLIPLLLGYLFWYCYRSMRVFYGQPRGRTLAKYMAISAFYTLSAAVLLAFTGVASALGG